MARQQVRAGGAIEDKDVIVRVGVGLAGDQIGRAAGVGDEEAVGAKDRRIERLRASRVSITAGCNNTVLMIDHGVRVCGAVVEETMLHGIASIALTWYEVGRCAVIGDEFSIDRNG